MRKFVVLIALLGLVSIPLMAQDTPKAELFGGYQYLHTGDISANGQTLKNSSQNWNGWDASATGYFNKYFGVQGDFSGSYATINHVSGHVYTYAGGPVIAYREGKVNPFVHALFGGIHLSGSGFGTSASLNGFTTAVGGGVDVQATKVVSLRLIQFDWIYYHFGNNTIQGVQIPSFSQSNNVRLVTGIVFRF
jgi:hypothetical protein